MKNKFWTLELCKEIFSFVVRMSEDQIEGPARSMLENLLSTDFTRADAFSVAATISKCGDFTSVFVRKLFEVEKYYTDPASE